jgi:pyridoxamine 5'-phosphate oxidase
MTPNELLSTLDRSLEDAKTGVLTTLDTDGRPRMRWMTPRRIKGRPRFLYTVSEAHAAKVGEIKADPRVSWLVQPSSLREVLSFDGRATVVDDPTLLQEFLEAVGKDLFMVWHLHPAQTRPHFVVIETALERGARLDARTGAIHSVTFG